MPGPEEGLGGKYADVPWWLLPLHMQQVQPCQCLPGAPQILGGGCCSCKASSECEQATNEQGWLLIIFSVLLRSKQSPCPVQKPHGVDSCEYMCEYLEGCRTPCQSPAFFARSLRSSLESCPPIPLHLLRLRLLALAAHLNHVESW